MRTPQDGTATKTSYREIEKGERKKERGHGLMSCGKADMDESVEVAYAGTVALSDRNS
jgi:hypothetical protein